MPATSPDGARVWTSALYRLPRAAASNRVLSRRAVHVVRHQNTLRARRGLRLIFNKVAPFHGTQWDDPPLAVDILAGAVTVYSIGNTMLTTTWGDTDGLNAAYSFKGSALRRVVPFGQYVAEHVAGPKAVLVRNMGADEEALWRAGDVAGLRRGGKDYGYGQPVVHFAIGERSSIGGPVAGEWHLPKSQLVRWTAEEHVTMGLLQFAETPDRFHVEVVARASVWPELARYYVGRSRRAPIK